MVDAWAVALGDGVWCGWGFHQAHDPDRFEAAPPPKSQGVHLGARICCDA